MAGGDIWETHRGTTVQTYNSANKFSRERFPSPAIISITSLWGFSCIKGGRTHRILCPWFYLSFCDSAVPCVLNFTIFFLIYDTECQERLKQQVTSWHHQYERLWCSAYFIIPIYGHKYGARWYWHNSRGWLHRDQQRVQDEEESFCFWRNIPALINTEIGLLKDMLSTAVIDFLVSSITGFKQHNTDIFADFLANIRLFI